MAKLIITKGETKYEIRAVYPNKARVTHIKELQRQSGLKLAELSKPDEDVDNIVVVSFLSQAAAGMEPKWAELNAGTMEDLGQFVAEPGDVIRGKIVGPDGKLPADDDPDESTEDGGDDADPPTGDGSPVADETAAPATTSLSTD